ncbi:MAG: hypothetical protein RL172_3178 [Bacteroidota bacterium]|jgi:hypothetical protein
MKKTFYLSSLFAAMLLVACGPQQDKSVSTDNKVVAVPDSTIAQIAKDAYLYGLPLVLMDITRLQMTHPDNEAIYKPVNQFRHNSFFPDASFKNVVRPNADTYYSIAWLDVTAEPLVLSLPDTKGRYYMMPIMDAYSNVFASPGTRTTGNKAGNFAIVGPQWKGQIPAGIQTIQSPTNIMWIIGRTQVNSKADGAKVVVPLQSNYKLIPLSAWGKPYVAPADKTPSFTMPKGDPNEIVKNMPVDEYFNYVNQLLAQNPPPIADKEALEKFATIGIGAGKKFDFSTLSDETKAAFNNAAKQVFADFAAEKTVAAKLVNGWNLGRPVIGTYGTDYGSRASTAFFGLGANLREDAIYPSCYFDAEGNALSGANKYVMHFDKDKTPPANAFWSLTMYDPEGYFIANDINRYTLGDRSNLKTSADGSVDIYIQKDKPEKAKEANWLPAPSGDFNLLMRAYWPKEQMLAGSWIPPVVQKIK